MADLKISQLTAATTPLAGTEVFPIVQSSATVKATIANVQAAPIAAQTADRMLFLNASKVPSTSANATFDGTNLGLGASPTFFDGRLAVGGHIAISAGNSLKLWNAGGTALNTVDSTGVNFTANTPAAGMTSQLLNWYEEGTFTCGMAASTSGTITLNNSYKTGRYTRIGRQVTVCGFLVVSSVSSPVGSLTITGLPYANGANDSNLSAAVIYATGLDASATTSLIARIGGSATAIEVALFAAGSSANAAGKVLADAQFTFMATYFVS